MSATPGRAQGGWATFCDRAPQVAVIGIAFSGSVNNILALCAAHGVRGPEAWSVASVIDLTAMIAAYERQRDKAIQRRRRGWVSFPTLLLIGDIGLSLSMQLAIAHHGAWGHIVSIVALVAMLMIVFMLERRAAHDERIRRAAAESGTGTETGSGTGPVPATTAVSATGYPPATPAPDTAPVAAPAATGSGALAQPASQAPAAAVRPPAAPKAARSAPPAYPGPRSVDHLLADARRLNRDYRAKHGKPIPLKDLRPALSCNNGLASQIRRQVLDEETKVA
jgi:hypothetical protein